MTELDRDTKLEFTEGEHIRQMLETKGWDIVKAALDKKILDLQMIGNVDGATAEEKVRNMEVRICVVATLYEWLKNDVYGRVQQQAVAKDAFIDEPSSDYINRG